MTWAVGSTEHLDVGCPWKQWHLRITCHCSWQGTWLFLEGLLGSNHSPEILGPAPHSPFPNLHFAMSPPDPVNILSQGRTHLPDPFLCVSKKSPGVWHRGPQPSVGRPGEGPWVLAGHLNTSHTARASRPAPNPA